MQLHVAEMRKKKVKLALSAKCHECDIRVTDRDRDDASSAETN